MLVLHTTALAREKSKLARLITHELFHLLSGNNRLFQEKLYNLTSFFRTKELHVPEKFQDALITNPDAPVPDYRFEAKIGSARHFVYPVLLTDGLRFETATLKFYDWENDVMNSCFHIF